MLYLETSQRRLGSWSPFIGPISSALSSGLITIISYDTMTATALSTKMIGLSFVLFHLLIILSFAAGWQDGCDAEARPDGRCDAPSASSDGTLFLAEQPNNNYEVPSVNAKYPNCRLFLAESTIPNGRRLIVA